jgi:tRNA(Arg) A34 adenosine deaminase TadA
MGVDHARFMSRAIELAHSGSAAGHGGPFGCVVVKDGEIVGEGFNQVLSAGDPTAHGEMVAIRDAARRLGTHDLRGCTVFNISVPCPMCLAAMYWARVDAVYYCCNPADAAAIGFDNAEIAQQLAKPVEAQSLPVREIPEMYPQARAVYDAWTRAKGRIY